MGKGFNNYMCKKFFHPASADNLKRVWIAQKKTEVEKKKQDELRTQYDREQELYQNKALLSKETKEKLELNFMYELPPGMKKEGGEEENGEGKSEYKFEWQRTWGHAPKESYLEKGDDFMEQPFGILVCQAKCIKCGKFGHMNTDKRCQLYGKSLDHDAPIQDVNQSKLLDEMKADGMAMRYTSWELKGAREAGPNHRMVEEERGVDRVELLKTMSKEEKKKLLKKLTKMEKKQKKKDKKDKRKKSSGLRPGSDDEWEEKPAKSTHSSPEERKEKKTERAHKSRSREEIKEEREINHKEKKHERSHRSRSREDRKERRSRSREDRKERRRERSDSREDRRRERSRSREDRRKDRHSSRDERRRDRD